MHISITAEGMFGLNWLRWKTLVQATESSGFYALYGSDHFVFVNGPDTDSLEVYSALGYLAGNSQRLNFGTMVSPLSVRDPVMITRQAMALNELSEGRMILGVGAGWEDREHEMFGYTLGNMNARMNRLEEGLEVISQLIRSDKPVNFSGKFYELHEATLRPRPTHKLRLLVGASGKQRTLPLIAKYADIWNAQGATPDEIKERNVQLDALLVKEGRKPSDVKRTMLRSIVCWRDGKELGRVADAFRRLPQFQLPSDNVEFARVVRENFGAITGTPDQVVTEFEAYADAGIEEMVLQYLTVDSLDLLNVIAEGVLPQIK